MERSSTAEVVEGSLSKWINASRGWQQRWCVLDTEGGFFTQYEKQEQLLRGEVRGFLKLKGAIAGIDDQDECTFTISTCGRTLHLQTSSSAERTRWLGALSDAILRQTSAGGRAEVGGSAASALARFDKKVHETGIYLHILMQLLNTYGKRVETLALHDETRVQYSCIHSSAARVAEYLKQAIEHLLILKQNAIFLDHEFNANANANANANVSVFVNAPNIASRTHSSNPSLMYGSGTMVSDVSMLSNTLPGRCFSASEKRMDSSFCGNTLITRRAGASPLNGVVIAKALRRLHAVASCESLLTFSTMKQQRFERSYQAVSASVSRSSSRLESGFLLPTHATDDEDEDEDERYFDADEYEDEDVDAVTSYPDINPQNDVASAIVVPEEEEQVAQSTAIATRLPAETSVEAEPELDTSANGNAVHAHSSLITKVIAADDDEYDELYDDIKDEELHSSPQDGSVITHLAKQVRIGMDLTKVTLPTFILETRSTLEMYADFFAHPDIWIAIADQPTPRDRFLQTLRWYLSAFHAGRRSSVAKKPYNPLLGEVFLCFWDVSGTQRKQARTTTATANSQPSQNLSLGTGKTQSSTIANSPLALTNDASSNSRALSMSARANGAQEREATLKLLANGPVNDARFGSVTFISEQVSHHPPVSALYAESIEKRMMLSGSIWTKSKFLGLSVAVEMIGQVRVHLLDLDEQYTVNFPTGYGRNILGQPWIELGGVCEIRCAKTGYHATVDFKTVPIYGGKRNRVKADVYEPGQKKPFVTVDGEWNDRLVAKWTTGRQELFVDTKAIPVFKKRVRPRGMQAANESRRVWQDVTRALKQRKIDEATRFKQALETKQRADAKQRERLHAAWKPVHFVQDESKTWRYVRPLTQRLHELAGGHNRQLLPRPSETARKKDS